MEVKKWSYKMEDPTCLTSLNLFCYQFSIQVQVLMVIELGICGSLEGEGLYESKEGPWDVGMLYWKSSCYSCQNQGCDFHWEDRRMKG